MLDLGAIRVHVVFFSLGTLKDLECSKRIFCVPKICVVEVMKPQAPITATVEDYLTAIYRLASTAERVGTSRLADFMGLSAPSVTVMVRRLIEQGLVSRSLATGGVELSDEGLAQALALLRKQRLCERFLTDKLGLDWGQAFDEAHRFEHALSAEVTDALERFLDFPTTCPHGNPIPPRAGNQALQEFQDLPLLYLGVGDRGQVSRVDEHSADLLRWFQDHGITPGASVAVEQIDPSGSRLLLVVGCKQVAVGERVAHYVRVRREGGGHHG
jgi:DtxR family transcriptional regulator, Mn-dependent transcriptional regulator